MGDAQFNPRSPQYRGPLPEYIPTVQVDMALAPNNATLADHPEYAENPPPNLPPEQTDVIFWLVVPCVFPMHTLAPPQWPRLKTPIAIKVLHRMPLVELKAQIDAQRALEEAPPKEEQA